MAVHAQLVFLIPRPHAQDWRCKLFCSRQAGCEPKMSAKAAKEFLTTLVSTSQRGRPQRAHASSVPCHANRWHELLHEHLNISVVDVPLAPPSPLVREQ